MLHFLTVTLIALLMAHPSYGGRIGSSNHPSIVKLALDCDSSKESQCREKCHKFDCDSHEDEEDDNDDDNKSDDEDDDDYEIKQCEKLLTLCEFSKYAFYLPELAWNSISNKAFNIRINNSNRHDWNNITSAILDVVLSERPKCSSAEVTIVIESSFHDLVNAVSPTANGTLSVNLNPNRNFLRLDVLKLMSLVTSDFRTPMIGVEFKGTDCRVDIIRAELRIRGAFLTEAEISDGGLNFYNNAEGMSSSALSFKSFL